MNNNLRLSQSQSLLVKSYKVSDSLRKKLCCNDPMTYRVISIYDKNFIVQLNLVQFYLSCTGYDFMGLRIQDISVFVTVHML